MQLVKPSQSKENAVVDLEIVRCQGSIKDKSMQINKTSPSKENAVVALEIVRCLDSLALNDGDKEFLIGFLEAAQRKLPHQASLDKERQRKR